MRRLLLPLLLLLLLACLLPSVALAQTNPCETALTQRTLLPSTATTFPVVVQSPDHGDTNKVTEYVLNIYPAGGTSSISQQVITRAAATLVTGTTDCYRMTVNRVTPLALDTDYAVRALARGPAGEGALTQFSNPFVFTSPARVGTVRVPVP